MPRITKKTKVTVVFEDEEDKPIETKKRIYLTISFSQAPILILSTDET